MCKARRMLDLTASQQKHRPYLSEVKDVAFDFVAVFHDHAKKNPIKCHPLWRANGVHGGVYIRDGKTGQTTRKVRKHVIEQHPFSKVGLISTSEESVVLMKLPQF